MYCTKHVSGVSGSRMNGADESESLPVTVSQVQTKMDAYKVLYTWIQMLRLNLKYFTNHNSRLGTTHKLHR